MKPTPVVRLHPLYTKEGKFVFSPVYSHVGSRMVLTTQEAGGQKLTVVDSSNGNLRAEIDLSGSQLRSSPVWSPDDTSIAFLAHQKKEKKTTNLHLVDSETGKPRINQSFPVRQSTRLVFAPDGKQIAFGEHCPGKLHRIEIPSGSHVPIEVGNWLISTPSYSPDGSNLAFTAYDISKETGKVHLVASGSEKPHFEVESPHSKVGQYLNGDPVFSPNGTEIALVGDGNFYRVDPRNGEIDPLLTYRENDVICNKQPIYAADGTLAIATVQGKIIVFRANAERKQSVMYAGSGYFFGSSPAFSTDGQLLSIVGVTPDKESYCHSQLFFNSISEERFFSQLLSVLRGHEVPEDPPVFHPNWEQIAYSSKNRNLISIEAFQRES